jgi:iron complex transport system ATP-binding protein
MNTPIIKLTNVCIQRQGKDILKGITLDLKADQHLAIIGPNGAGKSFLLRTLAADLIPSSGTTTILGKTFGKCSLWDLRKQIGYVSSSISHWYEKEASILDVVVSGFQGSYGLPTAPTQEHIDAAQKILKTFELEVRSFQKFSTLSDGQRRKTLLARALVIQPKLLIFDEPCQGLDIPTREQLLTDINELAKNTPIVYVTHHLEELPSCITHMMLLKAGKSLMYGEKDDLINSKNISELFDYPLEVRQKDHRYYTCHAE